MLRHDNECMDVEPIEVGILEKTRCDRVCGRALSEQRHERQDSRLS